MRYYNEIPETFEIGTKKYTLVKEYPNYALYKREDGMKECFQIKIISEGPIKYSNSNKKRVMIIDAVVEGGIYD